MLTPFGKALRQIRIEHGLKLLDVAAALGLSSAFLSAVESGRKTIPDGFVRKLGEALPQLTAADIKALRRASDQTRKEVRVDNLAGDERELVAAFARSVSDLPEELKARIKRELLPSLDGDAPFRRSPGMVVKPRSRVAIRGLAETLRDACVDADQTKFPIIEFLEFTLCQVVPNFVLEIRERREMGPMEGMVIAGSDSLALRSDVYEDACRDVGRARFTAAHELGHFLMHRDITLARTRPETTKIFYDSEWQADSFAGYLLMSHRHAPRLRDADHAAKACGMSPAAAGYQLTLHGRKNAQA